MSNDKQAMSAQVAIGDGHFVASPGNDRRTWTGGDDVDRPHDRGDLAERLARADLLICEMQAHMDELIEANLRLRGELSEMTLKWLMEKVDDR
jgi:hypothetical protein